MSYFNTKRLFLVPSFDIEVQEQEKIERFLTLSDNSEVANIISKYINNNTSKGGRSGYNYYRLFATIIYGFTFTKCTLRELADACKYDLRFIFLMEQERPRHTKFCDFINRIIVPNEEEIFALISTQIAKEMDIKMDDAFIDGTKFEANANKYKFVWKPTKLHRKLTSKASEIIRKYELFDNYREEEFIRSNTLANAITNLESKKEQLDVQTYKNVGKALVGLLEKTLDYEEKEEICGPYRNSYYKIDKDATAMALKSDYYSSLGSNMHAAYNVQVLVIKGLVFAYYVSQSRTDINDFIDVIERFVNFYGFWPKRICTDAGYGSLDNYQYLQKYHIENYVKHQSWEGNKSASNPDCYHLNDNDTITCLNGLFGYEVSLPYRHPRRAEAVFYRVDGCNNCNYMPYCKRFMHRQDDDFKIFEVVKDIERFKYESQNNLCSPKGIEMRVNRSIQVEGVFGITKQDYGYVRFRRRGLDKVSTESMLNFLGLNIAKLFHFYDTGTINKFWTVPENLEP
jgi:transposase